MTESIEPNIWKQLDAMKAEADACEWKLRRRLWRMKEPKLDGTLRAERPRIVRRDKDGLIKSVRERLTAEAKTPAELMVAVASAEGVCPTCYHSLSRCGSDGCSAPNRTAKKVITTGPRGGITERFPPCGCRTNAKPQN